MRSPGDLRGGRGKDGGLPPPPSPPHPCPQLRGPPGGVLPGLSSQGPACGHSDVAGGGAAWRGGLPPQPPAPARRHSRPRSDWPSTGRGSRQRPPSQPGCRPDGWRQREIIKAAGSGHASSASALPSRGGGWMVPDPHLPGPRGLWAPLPQAFIQSSLTPVYCGLGLSTDGGPQKTGSGSSVAPTCRTRHADAGARL